jgi:hypothetical protein
MITTKTDSKLGQEQGVTYVLAGSDKWQLLAYWRSGSQRVVAGMNFHEITLVIVS